LVFCGPLCGPEQPVTLDQPSRIRQPTLPDDDCTYRGDTAAAAGRFSIEIENRTLRFASFGLIALGDTTTVEDVELFHERLAALARSRALPDEPPPFDASWVAGAAVEPSSSTSLPIDTTAGRYVVVCYLYSNPDELSADEIPPPERAHVAAQLEVTS
jgi:hypothetical protein